MPLKEYQITGKNSIKLVIEDTIFNMGWDDFNYTTSAGTAYQKPYGISVSIASSNTYITLHTVDLPTTTGSGIEVRTSTNVQGNNKYGSKLYFDTTQIDGGIGKVLNILDKCPPRIVGNPTFNLQDDKTKTGKTLDSVTITYSENIDATSVSDTDYTILGYEVSSVAVSGATVTIFVNNLDYGIYTPGVEFTVIQVADIEDMDKNLLGPQNGITFK